MSKRRGGFTLIELLVVVAIIAVLISILLPALKRAKEQGRISVCLNNLKNIGTAASMYLGEPVHRDDLPWAVPFNYTTSEAPSGYGISCISEFVWGGGFSEKKPNEWPQGFGGSPWQYNCDITKISPKFRPMNRYLSNQVSWERKGDIPKFFQCPGDSSPAVPMVGDPSKDIEGDTPFKTWEFWGSSYPINWYWPYYYCRLAGGGGNANFTKWIGAKPNVHPGMGRDMLKGRYKGTWGSEFVIFYENRFNYCSAVAKPRGQNNPEAITGYRGWHGDLDMFAATFVDGHAAYKKFDSRYVNGPGWTTWPAKPWGPPLDQYNDKP